MLTFLLLLGAAGQTTVPGAILIDRDRLDRAPVQAPAQAAPVATIPAPIRVDDEAGAVRIAGIRFIGADAPAPVARAARPFLGKRATRATLTALATALSAGYAKSNVALYTVSIPAQTFARGLVVVRLVEGRVGHVRIVGDKRHRYRQLGRRLTPLTEEKPLSRDTFERQFTLVNAMPGLTTTPAFTDPEGNGDLLLTITPKQKRTRITAGFSSRGVASLGDGQFDIHGELYGSAIDGDVLQASASASNDLKAYRYASIGYSAPIGGSGLSASGSAAYLETRPTNYAATGTAWQGAATLAYPLIRSFSRSADVSLGVDGLNSDNAVLGNVATRERSRAVRLAASYAVAKPKRSVSVGGSLSHGLDVLDASAVQTLADLDFLKATLVGSAAQAIGKRAAIRLTASGQWSDDALPAAERFALGGPAIGRAFDVSILTGDRGAGGSMELAWRPIKSGRFGLSELYGFGDYGAVWLVPRGLYRGGNFGLASAGVGGRARYRDKAELGLEVARVLDDPYPGYRERWRFSVSWRVTA